MDMIFINEFKLDLSSKGHKIWIGHSEQFDIIILLILSFIQNVFLYILY